LMEADDEDNTAQPHDGLSKSEFSSTEQAVSTTSQVRRGKSSFATTPLTIRFNEDNNNSNNNNVDVEPMQKRANEMFGQLNETQVSHLMNVMKKADENRNVRRLILLLIQTCDGDDHNKTLEASRTALLNALIGMDMNGSGDRNEIKIYNTRREKSVRATTLPSVPITTYKSPNHEKYASSEILSKELEDKEATALPLEQTTYFAPQSTTNERDETTQNYLYSTTDAESLVSTTTEVPVTTTTSTITPIIYESNSERLTASSKPRFRLKSNAAASLRSENGGNARFQKSLGLNDEYQSEPTNAIEHKKADARALELLRSLYSLASRWGKK
jgi:hypothetical protein